VQTTGVNLLAKKPDRARGGTWVGGGSERKEFHKISSTTQGLDERGRYSPIVELSWSLGTGKNSRSTQNPEKGIHPNIGRSIACVVQLGKVRVKSVVGGEWQKWV